ncbi:MAG: VOC family protein [Methylacidiphilales bacterium]|nr:VOC family protein [Candidatus Methylacidiphilales bacterium]
MSIQSVAHVCIKTTDLDATTNFYCDALGMKKFFNFMRKEKIIGFYMKASNETFVEVFLTDEVEKLGKQVLSHFCLQTGSIEGLRKAIIERGYSPNEIKMGADNTPQFWMKDPNGLDIEFQQYTDQSSQVTGRDVEVDW